MTATHQSYLRIGVNVFAVALVVYEMYVGFTFGRSLFQNNHLSVLIAVLFAAIPIFTIMGMSFMTMGVHAEKTTTVVIGFVAFAIGLSVQWFFQYGFMNKNLEQKQEIAFQKSAQMQAHQSKLASIETALKANEKYAAVDAAGVNASIDLKKKQIEKINAQKCPDWDCKQNKPVQINALEAELTELEGQRNGTKSYKEALDARTAAYQSASTIHNTLATEDVFIANVAVLMGYQRDAGYHVFSMLYASFMLTLFLVLTFFSSVRSELEIVLEQKRARLRKEKPVQNDEPLQLTDQSVEFVDNTEEKTGFFNKSISTYFLNLQSKREETKEIKDNNPLSFKHGENIIDFEEAPHIMVAGTSGYGKSTTMRNIIWQLIAKNSPDSLQVVAIDFKRGAECAPLENVPHLIKPIAVDLNSALDLLNYVKSEMDFRWDFIKSKKVEKVQKLKEKIPFLLLIIDEGRGLEGNMQLVSDIASAGRAAGIHILFGTQYPTDELLGNQFTANVPIRICHYFQKPKATETVLGTKEKGLNAYDLRTRGDAILLTPEKRVRSHCCKFEFETFMELLENEGKKYGNQQPISPKEPSPKKTVFAMNNYGLNTTLPSVAYNLQPKAAAITAHASDLGSNVVQFTPRVQPATNATLSGYTIGNLALKNEENQQFDDATLVQPAKVANHEVQPDKTQQNQQGCNATTDATAEVANVQLATFKMQPPLATSEVRKLVDWALNELEEPRSDQAISDFIFKSTGRKLNKGSVYKYRLEIKSSK